MTDIRLGNRHSSPSLLLLRQTRPPPYNLPDTPWSHTGHERGLVPDSQRFGAFCCGPGFGYLYVIPPHFPTFPLSFLPH